MRQFCGVVRLVYNLALEQRRDWGRHYRRETGQWLGFSAQSRELSDLRKSFDWIAAVHVTPQQQALKDLDKAFRGFFSGASRFPKPRKRGEAESFRYHGREVAVRKVSRRWSQVRLPKIGWVKFRDTREMTGKLLNVTVIRDAIGWHLAFTRQMEIEPGPPRPSAVGVDRGVVAPLALSSGEIVEMPRSVEKRMKALRRAQKTLSRRRRGSKRYAQARARMAKLKSRQSRARRYMLHVASRRIAEANGLVAIEALRTKDMTRSARGTIDAPGRNVSRKAGLNRAILGVGWHLVETMLGYKLEERGGLLVKVDPRNTSRTCSVCSHVDGKSRESQAVFLCTNCGHQAHADINAARNILARAMEVNNDRRGNTPSLGVEGKPLGPCEASTVPVPPAARSAA